MNVIGYIQNHWVEIGLIALASHTFLKSIRDSIDKTPNTDDNFFEKFVTLSGNMIGYLFGKRPK